MDRLINYILKRLDCKAIYIRIQYGTITITKVPHGPAVREIRQ